MTRLFIFLETYFATLGDRVADLEERRHDDEGATLVEYALLVGGIAAIIAGLLVVFGGNLQDAFDDILP